MEPLAELGAIARRIRQSERPKVTIAQMAPRIGIGSSKLGKFELGKDPLSEPLQRKVESYFGWPHGIIEAAAEGADVTELLAVEREIASVDTSVQGIVRQLRAIVDDLAKATGVDA